VINHNNPTGQLIDKAQLVKWAEQLDTGFYLIVDEAFADSEEIIGPGLWLVLRKKLLLLH
jgi:histidinol-phosphate/aromatic aminotransferase/cobyric acid decarboxylase-like protein